MKRYKLIKEYPGSPKLGYIVKRYNDKYYYGNNFSFGEILDEYVENNPEFWEEIVEDPTVFHIGDSLTNFNPGNKSPYYIYSDRESYCKRNGYKYFYCKKDCKKWADEQVIKKEYEILSFRFNGRTFNGKCTDGKYWSNEGTWTYLGFDPSRETIISVKRLSDGEVFTIGDYLDLKSKRDYLYEIQIIDNEVRFKADFQKNSSWATSYTLNFINHEQKPLFTTEDGVDIYKEDEVWSTNINTLNKPSKTNALIAVQVLDRGKDFKYFSTKEAAEEYILMNKPCLSLNEILTAASKPSTFEDHIKILKRLIKSKL